MTHALEAVAERPNIRQAVVRRAREDYWEGSALDASNLSEEELKAVLNYRHEPIHIDHPFRQAMHRIKTWTASSQPIKKLA